MKAIKITPLAGLAAINNNQGGAFRAWTVARNLSNSGKASLSEIKSTLRHFGVHPRTARRWIAQAESLGLWQRDGDTVYFLSWGKAGAIFGSRWIAQPTYTKNPERLFQAGWHGLIYEMVMLSFEERLISRQTLAEITGMDKHRQLGLETRSIEKRPNFAKIGQLEKGSDWLEHVKKLRNEFDIPALFNWKGELVRQLPNLYLVNNPEIGTFKAVKRYPKAELVQFSHEKTLRDNGKSLANKRYFGHPKKGRQRAEKAFSKYGGERFYLVKVEDEKNVWEQVQP